MLMIVGKSLLAFTAPAEERITLQLKWTHAFQFAGYYAALEQGFYAEAGLDVQIVPADPGTDPVEKVINREAQFGVGSSGLLLARAEGKPVVVLGVIFQHSPYIIAASSDIHHLKDLKGKRFMLEPQAEELIAFLKMEGVPLDSLKLIPHSYSAEGLINGSTDGMSCYVSSEPYYFREKTYPYQAFNPQSAGIDFYGDNLFTSEQEIADNPDRVKAFLDASLRGWQYAKDNYEDVIGLIYEKYSQEHSKSFLHFEANQMLPLLQPDLVNIGFMNPRRWEHIAKTYVSIGLLPEDFSLTGFLYFDYITESGWFSRGLSLAIGFIFVISLIAFHIFQNNRQLSKYIVKIQQTSRELEESEARFKALHDASFGGIAIHDKGLILECNQGMADMMGYTLVELIGMDGLSLIAEESRPVVMHNIETGYEKPYEALGLKKNGDIFPMRLEARVVPYKGKNVRTVEFRDISDSQKTQLELQKAKEKAEESDRLKSAFLANMSHEIRTPMNGILGFAELLKDSNITLEEKENYIAIIEKSGERLLGIINDIIDLSKLDTGQIQIQHSPTNISEQLEFMLSFFTLECKTKGLKISLNNKLEPDEEIIHTDSEKLYAILTNLIKNAIKYTHEGSIFISCEKKQNNIEFLVRDTGIGIPEETKDVIFERFRQGTVALSRLYEGAGLGLAISKGYTDLFGGEIWVDSEVGQGSSFYFSIPINN